MSRFRSWKILSLVWAVIIFVSSSTVVHTKAFVHAVTTVAPVRLTEDGFGLFWGATWWVFVKGYHVLEFAILTYLLAKWLRGRPLWMPACFAFLYSVSDEIHQLWIPSRGGRFTDVLIDSLGIGLAVALLNRPKVQNSVSLESKI